MKPAFDREETKHRLRSLVRQYAYRRLDKPIRLSSGSESSEYFDGKQITMFPDRMVLFGRLIFADTDPATLDAVGGMSTGADPIAAAVSLLAWTEHGKCLPSFFVRKEGKKYGLSKRIEGAELGSGMNVLIVEDVITQGTATLKAIEAVEAAGAGIAKVVCLVDREAGGAGKISGKYPFQSMFRLSDFRS